MRDRMVWEIKGQLVRIEGTEVNAKSRRGVVGICRKERAVASGSVV